MLITIFSLKWNINCNPTGLCPNPSFAFFFFCIGLFLIYLTRLDERHWCFARISFILSCLSFFFARLQREVVWLNVRSIYQHLNYPLFSLLSLSLSLSHSFSLSLPPPSPLSLSLSLSLTVSLSTYLSLLLVFQLLLFLPLLLLILLFLSLLLSLLLFFLLLYWKQRHPCRVTNNVYNGPVLANEEHGVTTPCQIFQNSENTPGLFVKSEFKLVPDQDQITVQHRRRMLTEQTDYKAPAR